MRRAVLKPSLSGNGWDAGVGYRVLLFRDFAPTAEGVEMTDQERRMMRFAEVVKSREKSRTDDVGGDVASFVIEEVGLKQ